MRRDHQAALDTGIGLGLIDGVKLLQPLDVGDFKVVGAVLNFWVTVDFGKGVDAVDINVPDLLFVLQIHDNAVQPVSNLDANWVERQATRLLKIGVLSNFLPIQPDFPAQSPSAQSRRFPVIFHKTNIMFGAIQADCFQAAQI